MTDEKKDEKQETFKYILSGRSRDELLKHPITIHAGTDKEKVIVIPKMKTRQITESLKVLKEIEWQNVDYAAAIEAAVLVLPKLTGIPEEDILEVELDDWEVIFAQFEVKNKYFLLILERTGILPKIKAISEAFGVEIENISKK